MTRGMHSKVSDKGPLVDSWLTISVDMLFDEDAMLLSFFDRYADPEDEEDLKNEVIKYVGGVGGKTPIEEQNTTGESVEDVSITFQ